MGSRKSSVLIILILSVLKRYSGRATVPRAVQRLSMSIRSSTSLFFAGAAIITDFLEKHRSNASMSLGEPLMRISRRKIAQSKLCSFASNPSGCRRRQSRFSRGNLSEGKTKDAVGLVVERLGGSSQQAAQDHRPKCSLKDSGMLMTIGFRNGLSSRHGISVRGKTCARKWRTRWRAILELPCQKSWESSRAWSSAWSMRLCDYSVVVNPLPADVIISGTAAKELDFVHIFTKSQSELLQTLATYRTRIKQSGIIWVSWPKKASGIPSEVSEDTVRAIALPLGLVDIKICAIDDTWSGLKLMIRREHRK